MRLGIYLTSTIPDGSVRPISFGGTFTPHLVRRVPTLPRSGAGFPLALIAPG